MSALRVGVVGPGAIGSYVAVQLAAAGAEVTLLGRRPGFAGTPRTPGEHAELTAVPIGRAPLSVALRTTTDPSALAGVEVCLIAVKSRDTEQAAAPLADVLSGDAVVLSLQNGLRNADRLRAQLSCAVVPGVVQYNVYWDGPRLCQATKGMLFAGPHPSLSRLRAAFAAVGERMQLRDDIESVIAGKLLLNLNNGICAATGLGIADSLRSRDARWCFAACVDEGDRVMRAARIRPAPPGVGPLATVPTALLSGALRLPDVLVGPLARGLAGVAPGARSSTLQDLDRGKPTEIDDLNGGVTWLARREGLEAPCNQVVVDAVHRHEQAVAAGRTPDFVSPEALRSAMLERLPGR